MSTWGIVFLICLALAPFTGGMSLFVAGAMFIHSLLFFRPDMRSGIDDSQLPDIVPYYEDNTVRDRIRAEQREEQRQRALAKSLDEPPAYAMYQCSNSFCRHRARLLVWHGDNQECIECSRRMYREG